MIDMHFNGTNADGKTDLVLDMSDIREKGAKIKASVELRQVQCH